MFEKIQTYTVITLLTLLIWLYAEAQNPAKPLNPEVTIKLLPPKGSQLRVSLESPAQVKLLINGPTGILRTLEEQLRTGTLELTLGEEGLPTEPGVYSHPLIDYLKAHPVFANQRIHIQEVNPAVIRFTIDQLIDRPFDVEVGPFTGVETQGPVTIEPATVIAHIPLSLMKRLDAENQHLIADPRLDAARTYQPGEQYSVEASLRMPGIADASLVSFEPDRVRLTFTVRTTQVETTVTNVPVQIVLPTVDQNRYDIIISEPLIPELKITGPSDLITKINNHELTLTGQAIFSSDELTRGITDKTVSFDHLPDALKVNSPPIVLKVTITRRKEAGSE